MPVWSILKVSLRSNLKLQNLQNSPLEMISLSIDFRNTRTRVKCSTMHSPETQFPIGNRQPPSIAIED